VVARPGSGQQRLRGPGQRWPPLLAAWPHTATSTCAPAWLLLASMSRQGCERKRWRWKAVSGEGERRARPLPATNVPPQCRVGKTSSVTPSVLPRKQLTKPIHKHHVYVLLHVIIGKDKIS
jgi:hypothetical protein